MQIQVRLKSVILLLLPLDTDSAHESDTDSAHKSL